MLTLTFIAITALSIYTNYKLINVKDLLPVKVLIKTHDSFDDIRRLLVLSTWVSLMAAIISFFYA
jgi:hypothetical protein